MEGIHFLSPAKCISAHIQATASAVLLEPPLMAASSWLDLIQTLQCVALLSKLPSANGSPIFKRMLSTQHASEGPGWSNEDFCHKIYFALASACKVKW